MKQTIDVAALIKRHRRKWAICTDPIAFSLVFMACPPHERNSIELLQLHTATSFGISLGSNIITYFLFPQRLSYKIKVTINGGS